MFDETIPEENFIKSLVGSASLAPWLALTSLDDMWLVDGGLFASLDLNYPIDRCREEGIKDEDIIVDAVLCFP